MRSSPFCRSVLFRWPPGSALCFLTTRALCVGQHRQTWRSHLRWVVLAFAPFLYVPLMGLAILSPGVQLARSIKLPGQRLTPVQFGISAAVVCATAVVAAAIGLWVARRLGGPPTWPLTSRTPRKADQQADPADRTHDRLGNSTGSGTGAG